MPAYNVQGAPALGRLPGLPAKQNTASVTNVTQYLSSGLAEKLVTPIPNSVIGIGSGGYLWAAGKVGNVDGLGLAYWSNGSSYYVQPFTYGNDSLTMVGSQATAAHGAQQFGANTLRLWDGSFLSANRSSQNSFCRTSVTLGTYAVNQETGFLTIPTSGTCVSGEAFTCAPTSADFGYSNNSAANEPAWFVDGTEIDLFGTITIAGVQWIAVFVFNSAGQLARVHKIATCTKNASSAGTYLHVRRVSSTYHICVLNRGSSSGSYPMVAKYLSCSIDFVSDITTVLADQSWTDASSYYNKLIMAADAKALIFMLVDTSAQPYRTYSNFSRVYKLDAKGKAVLTSANNLLPSGWHFNYSGYANSNSVLSDLFTYTTYSSSGENFVRSPRAAASNSLAAAPITAGYMAVSLNHSYAETNQTNIYKGGYKFATLSDANGDLLMRFCPRVAVNQVDDGVSNGSYSAACELFELSNGYWLGLQQSYSSGYQLTLYKEQV